MTEPLPTDFEARLGRAYQGIENAVADMRLAVLTMETVASDALVPDSREMETLLKERMPGLTGHRLLVLTEDQDDALRYAMHHVGDLARTLHRTYYDGFEKARDAGTARAATHTGEASR